MCTYSQYIVQRLKAYSIHESQMHATEKAIAADATKIENEPHACNSKGQLAQDENEATSNTAQHPAPGNTNPASPAAQKPKKRSVSRVASHTGTKTKILMLYKPAYRRKIKETPQYAKRQKNEIEQRKPDNEPKSNKTNNSNTHKKQSKTKRNDKNKSKKK